MRKLWTILAILVLLAALAGCTPDIPPAESSVPGETNVSGEILTGWQTIDGRRYCFSPEGKPLTGWLNEDGNRY